MKSNYFYSLLYLAIFIVPLNDLQAQCSPDTQAPIVSCFSTVNIALGSDGITILQPDFFNAGSFDNCTSTNNLIFTLSRSTVTCADIGTPITITLTVTDEAGNSNSCISTAIVEDKIFPLAVCEAFVNVALDPSGNATLDPAFIDAGSSDNCDLSFSLDRTSVSCADIGTPIDVIMTITDSGGNSNSCFSTITVEDKLPPVAVCEAFVNVALDASGNATLSPSIIDRGSIDNCDLTYSLDRTSVSCSDIGSPVNVIMTITDPGGNVNSCFSTITVEDKLAPIAICEANVTLALPSSGTLTLTPSMFDAGSFDNCTDATNLIFSVSPSSVSCSDVGSPVTVTLTVTDGSGNSNTCTSSLTVQDLLPPSIACIRRPTVLLGADGTITFSPTDLLASSADNCDLTYTFSPATASCADLGPRFPVNIIATDPNGNSTSCESRVKIQRPRADDVLINGPAAINCGQTGINFNAQIIGGYGPFSYLWEIRRGANRGWNIVSGQGTSNIVVNAGTGRFKLRVTAIDMCGQQRRASYDIICIDSAPIASLSSSEKELTQIQPLKLNHKSEEINLYPNPSSDYLVVDLSKIQDPQNIELQIIDNKLQTIQIPQRRQYEKEIFDISNLDAGVYYLVIIQANKKPLTKKFIKIKE